MALYSQRGLSLGALTPTTRAYARGSLIAQTYVKDEATPILVKTATTAHPAFVASIKAAGLALKKRIALEFRRAQYTYTNTSTTRALKGGKPTFEDSGALKTAMTDVTSGVEVTEMGGNVSLKVSWDIPESGGTGLLPELRQNNEFEYFWVHERGATMSRLATPDGAVVRKMWHLRPRPWFQSALQEAGKQAGQAMAQLYGRAISGLVIPAVEARKFGWWGTSFLPMQAPWQVLPMTARESAMWVAPPSGAYKYFGALADMGGVFAGAFTEAAILSYIRQYAWGQIGVTRKTVRRKVRRRLWA